MRALCIATLFVGCIANPDSIRVVVDASVDGSADGSDANVDGSDANVDMNDARARQDIPCEGEWDDQACDNAFVFHLGGARDVQLSVVPGDVAILLANDSSQLFHARPERPSFFVSETVGSRMAILGNDGREHVVWSWTGSNGVSRRFGRGTATTLSAIPPFVEEGHARLVVLPDGREFVAARLYDAAELRVTTRSDVWSSPLSLEPTLSDGPLRMMISAGRLRILAIEEESLVLWESPLDVLHFDRTVLGNTNEVAAVGLSRAGDVLPVRRIGRDLQIEGLPGHLPPAPVWRQALTASIAMDAVADRIAYVVRFEDQSVRVGYLSYRAEGWVDELVASQASSPTPSAHIDFAYVDNQPHLAYSIGAFGFYATRVPL